MPQDDKLWNIILKKITPLPKREVYVTCIICYILYVYKGTYNSWIVKIKETKKMKEWLTVLGEEQMGN